MRVPGFGEIRPIVWGLGTFHAVTLMFVIVLIAFLLGELASLLERLGREPEGTIVGLLLFASLWVSSLAGTNIALPSGLPAGRGLRPYLGAVGMGIIGGGAAGGVFLAIIAAGATPFTIVNVHADNAETTILGSILVGIAIMSIFVFVAGLVAWIVGMVAGLIAGTIDAALLFTATRVAGSEWSSDESSSPESPSAC